MLLNVALFSSLLLVPAVLVVPSALGASVAQSQLNSRQAVQPIPDGWAGAIITNDNGDFNWVIGTFTVPKLITRPVRASASAWVGISGTSCPSILRTGVTFTVSSTGQPQYSAWYQLYPGEPSPFSEPDIIVFAGDVVSLSVLATSGRVKIVNLTNGMRAEQNLTSNTPLCGQRAEWIVDDKNSMEFPNFGTVTFTDAVAAGTGGEGYYAASQGSLTDVKKNGRGRTYTSVSSDFSVTIKYVEPKEQATSPDTSRRS